MNKLLSLKWLYSPRALLELLTFCVGGDPQKASSSSTTTQTFSPEETAARNKIIQQAGSAYDTSSGVYNSILNPQAKPISPSAATTQGQQMVAGAATGSGQTIANNAAGASNFGTSGAVLSPGSNPALQGVLDTATRRIGQTYTDPGGVLSQIRSNFNSASDGQSSREAIASGIAGRGYLQTVGDTTGNILNNAYNSGLDYMGKSLALAPNTFNLQTAPGAAVGAVGAQQEGYQQLQNNYDAAGKLWPAQSPYAALSPYASIISGMSNPTVNTSGSAPVAGKNPMAPVGAALMGGSAATMMGFDPMMGAGAMLALSVLNS